MDTTKGNRTAFAAALALLALCLLGPAAARAQWTTSGANVSNTNSGNVGVGTGTDAPTNKLTVSNGTATGNDAFALFGNVVPGSGQVGLQFGRSHATTGSFILQGVKEGVGANHLSLQPDGGRVGVGTKSPADGLHVHNAFGMQSLRVSGNGPAVVNFLSGTAPANQRLYQWRSEGGLFRMSLVNDAESGYARQNILVANSGGLVGVGTATPARALSIEADVGPALGVGSGGVERGTLGVTTTAGNWFAGTAVGDTALRSQTTDLWVGTYSGARAVRFVTNDAQRMVIDGAGNVGVGTASPAYKLDVGGSVNASGLCLGGSCKSSWSEVGASQWSSGAGSSISYGAGRVGVGTVSPLGPLSVGDSGAPGSDGYLVIGKNNGAGARHYRIGFDASFNFVIGDYGNNNVAGAWTSPFAINWQAPSSSFYIDAAGKVGIGTTTPGAGLSDPTVKLDVQGSLNVSGNISAKYQDVAEWVPSSQKLAAGTVVILDSGRSNHVVASSAAYDTKVAGVVSAQPGLILGEGGDGKVMVATTGRVKVRVDATRGAVKVGDLLVTSGVEGVAMKSTPIDLGGTPIHRPGTIIGKALEPLEKGVGEILVLLSLQ